MFINIIKEKHKFEFKKLLSKTQVYSQVFLLMFIDHNSKQYVGKNTINGNHLHMFSKK